VAKTQAQELHSQGKVENDQRRFVHNSVAKLRPWYRRQSVFKCHFKICHRTMVFSCFALRFFATDAGVATFVWRNLTSVCKPHTLACGVKLNNISQYKLRLICSYILLSISTILWQNNGTLCNKECFHKLKQGFLRHAVHLYSSTV